MLHARKGAKFRYQTILPKAVETTTHKVVHDVVGRGDAAENLAYQGGFVTYRDVFET